MQNGYYMGGEPRPWQKSSKMRQPPANVRKTAPLQLILAGRGGGGSAGRSRAYGNSLRPDAGNEATPLGPEHVDTSGVPDTYPFGV
jgi:hypothetical protein